MLHYILTVQADDDNPDKEKYCELKLFKPYLEAVVNTVQLAG